MRETIRAAGKTLALEALSAVRAPAGRRRFRAAVAEGTVRLNIGAGLTPVDGWVNTDIHWRSRCYLDLLHAWPIPEATVVTHVYADNVIEHFTLEDARRLLSHAYEALSPGGGVRLATPDVERTARAYLEDATIAGQILDRHRRHGYRVEYPVDLLRVTFAENGHWMGYCFDEASLRSELERAGFVEVERQEPGESADPTFAGLETRTDELSYTQLVMEARRPGSA